MPSHRLTIDARRQIGSIPLVLIGLAALSAIAEDPPANKPSEKRQSEEATELEPLPLVLPNPVFCNWYPEMGVEKWARKHSLRLDLERPGERRPAFLAPEDTRIVSGGKPVTASDPDPSLGRLEMITNGDRETFNSRIVQFASGPQHVTIDLGRPVTIDAVVLWHDFAEFRAYRDVVVQLSNDPEFPADQTVTVFNNDRDNSAGLGEGEAPEYIENDEGLLVANYERKNDKLVMTEPLGEYRYVRCWSNGSTAEPYNRYTEVEVWGRAPENDDPRNLESTSKLPPNLTPLPVEYANPPSHLPGPPQGMSLRGWAEKYDLRLDFDRIHERRRRIGEYRLPFWAPDKTEVISRGKPVDSPYVPPMIGSLDLITDGDKEPMDGRYVELIRGVRDITIDLEKKHTIDAILVWHGFMYGAVYRDVIVQLSNDADFPADKTITVFNNDHDNSAGLGKGDDYEYIETHEGLLVAEHERKDEKLVWTRPLGEYRYVRCWSNGSFLEAPNHYTEVEVWGRAAENGSDSK